ncbi:MAG: oligosaccharide flippase family protein, partial [Caldilinea sp.]|nr:oligosaccharide flippase family protein [Caldilinea sp.]MDW8440103.1 oligosaccharide flippase family protein [Caldilineaceae bacterium]
SSTSADAGVIHTGRRVLINTGALTGASLWRILISFVLQVLIARRLGVEGLGHYTIALAYLNVGQVISELGLPTLLVRDLAQNPTHRRVYFLRLLGIQILAGLLVWLALIGLGIVLPFGPVTATSLWLVGASLPLYAVTSATQTLFQAGERMELVMGVEVTINTLILLISLGVLWLGGDELALIGVLIITQAISAILCLTLLARSRLLALPQEPVSIKPCMLLRQTAPFFGLAISDVLLQRLDILLLSVIAGPAVTGVYSAAYNIVRVLMKLIQSFWRALYPTLSRLHRHSQERYLRLRTLSLRFGLLAVLPAASISFGAAAGILQTLFGADYGASVEVYRWLIWAAPLFLLEVYATTVLMIERRLRASLWISGAHILATLIFLPGLTLLAGAGGAGLAVVLAGATGALLGAWLLHTHRFVSPVDKKGGLLLATLLSGVLAAVPPFAWMLNAVLSAAAYAMLCWMTGVLTPGDFMTLRRILLNKPSE